MAYQKLNNFLGWFVWAIASFVFISTVEPTASFWDCGEFIATANKLMVGHPPGAPFFMIMGRMFAMFGGHENAAYMVNILSALCSSFTILFLFWTITALAKKLFKEENMANTIAILGSGAIGALAYTFSDSFWFSATEGEVYAMSSLFTAVVFWLILKWEARADKGGSDKWIILIAYLMGLSIGVHLLNLLCIPAIVFVYYFKKYPVSRKGLIITSIVSIVILGIIQYGIIPGSIFIGSRFELLAVNSFGMPFNSGLIIYCIILALGLAWAIRYTHKNSKPFVNMALLCVTVIMIGYSSYAMIVIRSSANPPMDENNPEDVFSLISYLNREQYGDRPLITGQFFNSPLDNQQPYTDGSTVYYRDEEKGIYVKDEERSKNSVPNYDKRFTGFFPRMWSPQGSHVNAYKEWSDFKGKPIQTVDREGKAITINKPTFMENMRFFFKYQIGHMYFRYFMWNFAGRQNDEQGHGEITKGNWISGITFLDEMRIGPQKNVPKSITENEAHNKFYLLPFILGIIGLVWQFGKSKKDFAVVLMLFFFTGIAIVIYLNQYPYQPRERDYAYVGSFYAFAIWIGLGVVAIFDFLKNKVPATVSASIATLACVIVPGIMAAEGWDDHDRSGRYTARDFAINYLESCAPNAILFTNGDNDTFPLWYAQEVEGIRTDIRVVNLSLFNTDWYVDQMRRAAYDAEPIPHRLPKHKYRQGVNDVCYIVDKNVGAIDVDDIIKFVESDDLKTKLPIGGGKQVDFIPTKSFKVKVDKNQFTNDKEFLGLDSKKDTSILNEIQWNITKNYILKNDLMILDILAANDWKRPIYFAVTTGDDAYLGLQEHFQLEGLTYRLVPVKTNNSGDGQTGRVNTDLMYENMMNKFKWGGMETKDIYMDENNRRMCMNLRNNFGRLANELIKEGKKDKALKVLEKCIEVMPDEIIPYDFFMLQVVEGFYKLNENEKGNTVLKRMFEIYEDNAKYYLSLSPKYQKTLERERDQAMAIMQRLTQIVQQYSQEELGKELEERFNVLHNQYMGGAIQ